MGTKLYKDGDQMGIWTDAKDERTFLEQISRLWNELIERGFFIGVGSTTDGPVQAWGEEAAMASDWEFQFLEWLPQVVEICCKYRGYKADVTEDRVLFCGNIMPDEFMAEVTTSGAFGYLRNPTPQEQEAPARLPRKENE